MQTVVNVWIASNSKKIDEKKKKNQKKGSGSVRKHRLYYVYLSFSLGVSCKQQQIREGPEEFMLGGAF